MNACNVAACRVYLLRRTLLAADCSKVTCLGEALHDWLVCGLHKEVCVCCQSAN